MTNTGILNLTNLDMGNGTALTLNGSNMANVNVESGSTLTLGANTTLSGYLNVQDSGSTFNAQGHAIAANTLYLGWFGNSPVTVTNLGLVTATNLDIGNGTALTLNGSNLANANVESGSALTLGANTTLSGYLNVEDSGSTLNAQGHAIAASNLYLGWFGNSPVTVTNLGLVTATNLDVGNGTALTLHGGDVINNIDLQSGSVLTVEQTHGIGLTLNGTSRGSLAIDPSSMDLVFTSTSRMNWDFRWKDPSSTRTGSAPSTV